MSGPTSESSQTQIMRFYCTLAVSRHGIHVLMSQVPSRFEGWIVDGDFPADDGWIGLPQQAGLYECCISVQRRGDEPEVKVVSCKPTTVIIKMAVVESEVPE